MPVWGLVLVALGLTHVTIASVTIYLHRHQTHRALSLHPAVAHFFRFWLWLTTATVTREWVAIHRKHHDTCETPDDPHSPQQRGIAAVLFGGAWLYRQEARRADTLRDYGHNTPDDWLERHVYTPWSLLGVVLMAALDVALFGLSGLAVWVVQMLWIPFWAAGVINGLGHYAGYRNSETADASRNLVPWGLIVGGEELHNNHHAYPDSARLALRRFELDIGWLYICALERFGLAKVRRVAHLRTQPGKQAVDLDTVRAVLHSRYRVLALYTAQVLHPVLKREHRGANPAVRQVLARVRHMLGRDEHALDSHARQTLATALSHSAALSTAFQFRQQLRELWSRSNGEHSEPVQRLHAWCVAAEQSGIQALQDYARTLRAYTLRPV